MNSEQLAQALKITPIKAEEWIDAINETFERFDISTPERQACFLGQCAHESGGFATLKENLNYSAEGLTKVWPKRFPSLEAAQPYHRNPEKIANKIVEGKLEKFYQAVCLLEQSFIKDPDGYWIEIVEPGRLKNLGL